MNLLYISNRHSGTHFVKSWFLDLFLTFSSIFLQKTNRELPNLEHTLPKCVPEWRSEIWNQLLLSRTKFWSKKLSNIWYTKFLRLKFHRKKIEQGEGGFVSTFNKENFERKLGLESMKAAKYLIPFRENRPHPAVSVPQNRGDTFCFRIEKSAVILVNHIKGWSLSQIEYLSIRQINGQRKSSHICKVEAKIIIKYLAPAFHVSPCEFGTKMSQGLGGFIPTEYTIQINSNYCTFSSEVFFRGEIISHKKQIPCDSKWN